MRACEKRPPAVPLRGPWETSGTTRTAPPRARPGLDQPSEKRSDLNPDASGYTPEQSARLRMIHDRLIEARRELDALIGDAYLRPRASIVPVHFLDLAAAAEKLRWAEKEWRELDQEMAAEEPGEIEGEPPADPEEPHAEVLESSGALSS